MPKHSFSFRKFAVHQSRSAMKVGTDSVLLGSWADLKDASSVLDIGTGTGILSLISAQRNPNAPITAIEIDADAAADAQDNFRNSPWEHRFTLLNCDFCTFIKESSAPYPLSCSFEYIISNPPYFSNSLLSPDRKRSMARHTDSLSYRDLMRGASRLLAKNGILGLIVPTDCAADIRSMAFEYGLYTRRQASVCSRPNGGSERTLLEFSFSLSLCRTEEFTIHTAAGCYSSRFVELTEEIYAEGYFR